MASSTGLCSGEKLTTQNQSFPARTGSGTVAYWQKRATQKSNNYFLLESCKLVPFPLGSTEEKYLKKYTKIHKRFDQGRLWGPSLGANNTHTSQDSDSVEKPHEDPQEEG